jgi:hypothetical protein
VDIQTGRPGISASGSNANGDYVQFADGTQICWGTFSGTLDVTTAGGGAFRNGSTTAVVTFPSAFISAPRVTGGGTGTLSSSDVIIAVSTSTVSATTAQLLLWRMASATAIAVAIQWVAVGRWK